jgi:hypothetical protein
LTNEEVRELIEALEAEVNNGGFDQFFFNSAGDNSRSTIEALEMVGAKRTAEIVRRACARFPGGMPPEDRFTRQDALEEVSPESDVFERDDDAFLAYEEDLAGLVAAFEGT